MDTVNLAFRKSQINNFRVKNKNILSHLTFWKTINYFMKLLIAHNIHPTFLRISNGISKQRHI